MERANINSMCSDWLFGSLALWLQLHRSQGFGVINHGDPAKRPEQFGVAIEVSLSAVEAGNMRYLTDSRPTSAARSLVFTR
jgi:hypothetical protein